MALEALVVGGDIVIANIGGRFVGFCDRQKRQFPMSYGMG
jgi:hypothetical protein